MELQQRLLLVPNYTLELEFYREMERFVSIYAYIQLFSLLFNLTSKEKALYISMRE